MQFHDLKRLGPLSQARQNNFHLAGIHCLILLLCSIFSESFQVLPLYHCFFLSFSSFLYQMHCGYKLRTHQSQQTDFHFKTKVQASVLISSFPLHAQSEHASFGGKFEHSAKKGKNPNHLPNPMICLLGC